MRTLRSVALSLAFLTLVAGTATAGENGTPVRPNAGFDLLKRLVGTWEAKSKEGTVAVRYELVSGGTALLETLSHPGATSAMVTVYHADGDQVMMTHFCDANNQPRMRCAKPAEDGKTLTFAYVDCTNLPTAETGHMQGLVVTLDGADHLTEQWTWTEGGKSGITTFRFERKKA